MHLISSVVEWWLCRVCVLVVVGPWQQLPVNATLNTMFEGVRPYNSHKPCRPGLTGLLKRNGAISLVLLYERASDPIGRASSVGEQDNRMGWVSE